MTPWPIQFVILGLTTVLVSSWAAEHVDDRDKPWPPPPVFTEKAKMARYLAHYTDWGVVSALLPSLGSVPFGMLQSFADGPIESSTGTPYFYIADISQMYECISHNNTVSVSATMEEGDQCKKLKLDPEEPLCARLMLTGKMIPVKDQTELTFVRSFLFVRHPAMKHWNPNHGWHFYKLQLTNVYMVDFYGPATLIPLSEYYKATPPY